jgi:hypothetical protein
MGTAAARDIDKQRQSREWTDKDIVMNPTISEFLVDPDVYF